VLLSVVVETDSAVLADGQCLAPRRAIDDAGFIIGKASVQQTAAAVR